MRSEENVKTALDLTEERFGRVNAVVNSAAIGTLKKTLDGGEVHSLETFVETLKVIADIH